MRSLRVLALALVIGLALPASADILKVTIEGVIHPITEEVVDRAIREAEANGDSALLIVLRTPGGLETSMRKMIEKIVASKVPVIVYVSPGGSRAASAGFFLLVSADVAAMAPGTNTGAAHPVVIGQEKVDEIMNAKMTNDSAAFMRSIVAKRGRNVELAEKAVRESVSFTEQEALDQNLIDIVATDEADLLAQLEGRSIKRFNGETLVLELAGQPVRERVMTLRQRVMNWMMDPNIAFLLLSLGALALYAEFNHPGAILPGVVGLILILLAVFALNLLPTRFAALTLIVIAFILFALEAKFTSYGVLGAGGVVCMTLGAVLLVDGPIPEMRVQWLTALGISLPFGVISVFLMTIAMRAMRLKVVTGEQGLVGEVGVAKTPLAPAGKIFVHGEIWNAVSTDPVAVGDEVRVESIDGLTLAVRPVASATPPAESSELA